MFTHPYPAYVNVVDKARRWFSG